jgi:hypothetical protein
LGEKIEYMIEEKQKSLKEMLEEEARSPGDENMQR